MFAISPQSCPQDQLWFLNIDDAKDEALEWSSDRQGEAIHLFEVSSTPEGNLFTPLSKIFA